jgi:molybdenum cofactor guanylyltransferase
VKRRCTGVILAGGLSTRYGGLPKGLEHVHGQRIIDRVASALSEVTDSLLLVANDDGAEGWLPGVRRERDIIRDQGSLGGIHAAISHAGEPALVVAWDMPFVPVSLLRELREIGEGADDELAADAVVPESGSKRGLEPLCAWYAPACLPAIEERLGAGDRRVIAFYGDVRLVRLPAERVARHGDPSTIFMNVNTPEELALAEKHASTTNGGRDRQEA